MSTQVSEALAAASARIGETRVHRGQKYLCVAAEPYTRRDGAESALLVWESHCKRCDEVFAFKTPNSEKFQPNRRCQAHRRRFGSGPVTAPPVPQRQDSRSSRPDYTARNQGTVPLLDHELIDDEGSDLWPVR